MSATIGRDAVVDLVVGNRSPRTVHFNFVVVANHAALGRPTIHQIAARASAIISFEFRVARAIANLDVRVPTPLSEHALGKINLYSPDIG